MKNKNTGIIILFLILIIFLSNYSLANSYKIYTNTDEISFEINSPENRIKSNEIIVELYFDDKNKNNIKNNIFLQTSDLIDKKGNIIPAKNFKINLSNNKFSYKNLTNKVIIKKNEGKITFCVELDQSTSYYPPGEYRGNLIIGDRIYVIPIFLKINTFAQLDINRTNIRFKLDNPAQSISNKEEIEIFVKTNLENWDVKLEFSEGLIHEDGKFSFPLENILCSENRNQNIKKVNKENLKINSLVNPQFINFNSFEKIDLNKIDNSLSNNGNYNLKLSLWADIRNNWNCAKAGEYTGMIYLTFIDNN